MAGTAEIQEVLVIHIIQNDPLVPLGRIQNIIDEANSEYYIWRAWEPGFLPEMPEKASALIVLGGTMGADDDEKFSFIEIVCRWISKAVELDIPFLGICLGGQLLARVCGGRLIKDTYGEKGCMPVDLTAEGKKDMLFGGLPSVWPSFQWHNDSFVPPLGSKVLAASSVCTFQAFRLGKNVYGVQFHPEVTPVIASDWVMFSEEANARLEDFRACYSEYDNISRKLLFNFLKIAGCENFRI